MEEGDEGPEMCEQRGEWMTHFCVVDFDLELGQTLRLVYPSDTPLTEEERSNIAYSSFPDSNSHADSADTIFSFRLRKRMDPSSPPAFRYGYVYFRQKRDDNLTRFFSLVFFATMLIRQRL